MIKSLWGVLFQSLPFAGVDPFLPNLIQGFRSEVLQSSRASVSEKGIYQCKFMLNSTPGAPRVEHQGWSRGRRCHVCRHQDGSTIAGAAAGGAKAAGTSAGALGLEQQLEVGKFPMITSQ